MLSVGHQEVVKNNYELILKKILAISVLFFSKIMTIRMSNSLVRHVVKSLHQEHQTVLKIFLFSEIGYFSLW